MNDFINQFESEFLYVEKYDALSEQDGKQKNKYKTRKFYYERYALKVLNDNKKHMDNLLSEFRTFAELKENKDLRDVIIEPLKK